MSKITLNTVNYYDLADIYSFEVDNRPLYDISSNIDLLNTAISNLGFYQEIYANPETEPPGGFSPLTCVLYGQNGLLFPIDISQPVTTLDYSKYPIFLVLENLGSSLYKCLGFSAMFSMPGLFNKFLSDSIGKAIKIGPGGSLVDEIYFDLYYSDYNYQNLIIGKVLTPTSIAFGGNQVSVLGDNRFIAKNRDDYTTGLVTKIIQNDVNSTAFKSILTNTATSAYPFSEYINQIVAPIGGSPGKVPIYFTSLPLTASNGSFTISQLETVLNEIHFAGPSISASTQLDQKYKTAGVNVGSLLGFSENYLIHAKPLSTNLQEIIQQVSTSLHFDSSVNLGLSTSFDTLTTNFGNSSTALPSVLKTASTNASGVQFGDFKSTGVGGFLYLLSNNSVPGTTYSDSTEPFPMSSLQNGTALILSSQAGGATGSSALMLTSDGPLLLDSTTGVFCVTQGTYPASITNKQYVDQAVLAAANSANSRVPLAGNTSDTPITSSLYWDTTTNTDPSTVCQFNTISTAQIKSAYPVEIKALATTDYQVIRGATPASGLDTDLTNRLFVTNAISTALGTAIGSNFVSRVSPDTITASKTFGASAQIITNNSIPFVLTAPIGVTTLSVQTSANIISFDPSTPGNKVKLETSATEIADTDTTVVTKKFAIDTINSSITTALGDEIYAIWNSGNRTTVVSTVTQFNDWGYATRGITPDVASTNFLTVFDLVENGALHYKLTTPAVFTVNVSDARIQGVGPAFPGTVYRTQTLIAVKSGGTLAIIARNIHQDDTDGNSINSLVGSSCSAIVYLQQDDILYILSEQADTVSASLARIR